MADYDALEARLDELAAESARELEDYAAAQGLERMQAGACRQLSPQARSFESSLLDAFSDLGRLKELAERHRGHPLADGLVWIDDISGAKT